jgi:hypothetical protein
VIFVGVRGVGKGLRKEVAPTFEEGKRKAGRKVACDERVGRNDIFGKDWRGWRGEIAWDGRRAVSGASQILYRQVCSSLSCS